MPEMLGERLRKLRLSKGTSQEETAAVFSVPKQTWSNWVVEREETSKARIASHTESTEAVKPFVKVDGCK